MKRTASMLLALVMVLSLCTIGALADTNTATITAYDANEDVVGSGYTSLGAAAAAAGVNGMVVISEGTVYFDVRQGISTDGVTLKGAGKGLTTITTSSSFGASSVTNRKALLTITATGVTVQDISFDGGTYGRNLVPTNDEGTEFNVVRVNSGSAMFTNVNIAGSTRTLLSVGTSSNSATVTATGLTCQGMPKVLSEDYVYADVNIVNGDLTLGTGCVVDAFISLDPSTTTKHLYESCGGLYTVKYPVEVQVLWFTVEVDAEVTSTVKHYAYSYHYCVTDTERDTYADAFNYSSNLNAITGIVTEAKNNLTDGTVTTEDLTIAQYLLEALTYATTEYPDNTDLANLYTLLNTAYQTANV